MSRIVLVHGIRSNGVSNIYRLEPWLRGAGHEVVRASLPIRRAIQVRWCYQRDAATLADQLEVGDVLIGHSYGGALSYLAAQRSPVSAVFLFNAALDRDVDLSAMLGRPPVWCVYSQADRIVWFSGLLPAHIFGRAGQSGLHDLPPERNVEIGGGHSDAFVGQGAERWADFICGELEKFRG